MEYRTKGLLLLALLLLVSGQLLAQPGCGDVFLMMENVEQEQFEKQRVKAFNKLEGHRKCFKKEVYAMTSPAPHYVMQHNEGRQEIILKYEGKKMKLNLHDMDCIENYLIEGFQFEEGDFNIQLKNNDFERSTDATNQQLPCYQCLRIPFDQFVKEH